MSFAWSGWNVCVVFSPVASFSRDLLENRAQKRSDGKFNLQYEQSSYQFSRAIEAKYLWNQLIPQPFTLQAFNSRPMLKFVRRQHLPALHCSLSASCFQSFLLMISKNYLNEQTRPPLRMKNLVKHCTKTVLMLFHLYKILIWILKFIVRGCGSRVHLFAFEIENRNRRVRVPRANCFSFAAVKSSWKIDETIRRCDVIKFPRAIDRSMKSSHSQKLSSTVSTMSWRLVAASG